MKSLISYLVILVFLIGSSYATLYENDDNIVVHLPLNDTAGNPKDYGVNNFLVLPNGTLTYRAGSLANWSDYSMGINGGYLNITNLTRALNTSRNNFTILWLVITNKTGEQNMWGSMNNSGLRGFRKYDRLAQDKNYFLSYNDISGFGEQIGVEIIDANKKFDVGRHWCAAAMVNESGGSIWRNGTELGYDNGIIDPIDRPHFFIGFEKDNGARFNGNMSDFVVFNRSFTPTEIKDYCTNGIQPAAAPPVEEVEKVFIDTPSNKHHIQAGTTIVSTPTGKVPVR